MGYRGGAALARGGRHAGRGERLGGAGRRDGGDRGASRPARERLSTAAAVREQHGKDPTYHAGRAPDAVAFARSTEEVAEIVAVCARHGVPVIAFGTGTSLEGHIEALQGGVTIDLSGLDAILEVNAADLDCRVEAGVTRTRLNTHLRDTGLFFPIDPGADASLGGMAATRASGTNAVRYGTMREAVLGLTVVTADGQVVRTGGRARKSAAGYDLTRLFVGSEGTLGIITEVQLRLWGIPEAISAAVCSFETLAGAVDTVIATIQAGVPIARIELLDEVQVRACNLHSGLGLAEAPTLFFEFHGSEAGVASRRSWWGERAGGSGRLRLQLVDARRGAQPALGGAAQRLLGLPGAPTRGGGAADRRLRADLAPRGVHPRDPGRHRRRGARRADRRARGDGNFHLTFLLDPDDPAETARADAVSDRMVRRALAMGGTCTGEHGVGYGKIAYLEAEHPEGVVLMRKLKRALDPETS